MAGPPVIATHPSPLITPPCPAPPCPALHHPSPNIDFILFPYEQLGCILYNGPLAGLKSEKLCEGDDEVIRHWMRKLRARRIALLIA